MIHVIANITVHPGQLEAVLAAFKENAVNVRAEPGCLQYVAVIDAEGFGKFQAPLGPDSFAVIEKWESADALKAHAVAPHMAAYGAKTKEMTASRAIHILVEPS